MTTPAIDPTAAPSPRTEVVRVAHVVPSIGSEASGPSYSVPRLCKALAQLDVDVRLHVLEPLPASPIFDQVAAYPTLPLLRRLGVSPAMARRLKEEARRLDILHTHSLWMMPNMYPREAVRGARCKLVFSPRGTLSTWALRHSRWRKKLVWHMGQRAALQAADAIHATSDEEYGEIRAAGLAAPVAIIPNGVDIPPLNRQSAGPTRRLLFLSRIHEKKGVDRLLRVWRRLQAEFPDWECLIVGPLAGHYPAQMQELARQLQVERLTFHGEALGTEKTAVFQSSSLFVLPTHSENFGMAVAEALANGVPAVVTRGAPWAGLAGHRCGWWIDNSDEALEQALRQAMRTPGEELTEWGMRGRAWMQRDFSWERIAEKMLLTYLWIKHGGETPDWVRLS